VEVLAGSSLLDHPIEFICARKDSAAMTTKLEGPEERQVWGGARGVWMTSLKNELLGLEAGGELGGKKKKTKPDCLLNLGYC